jgi:hypothetical protein
MSLILYLESDVIGIDHPSAQTTTNQFFVGSEERGTTEAILQLPFQSAIALFIFSSIY